MRESRGTILTILLPPLLMFLAAAGLAWAAEDDLAVVKRAVSSPTPSASASATATARAGAATAARPASSPRSASEPRARVRDRVTIIDNEEPPPAGARPRSGRAPQWLKVRIVERGKRGHVLVNLPLGVARALGDDFPIDIGCHRGRNCATLRLGDILRELQVGHNLVEIDDDDTTVRV